MAALGGDAHPSPNMKKSSRALGTDPVLRGRFGRAFGTRAFPSHSALTAVGDSELLAGLQVLVCVGKQAL